MAILNAVVLQSKEVKGGRNKVRISVAHNGETRYIVTDIIFPRVIVLTLILLSYSSLRPFAIFPKWSSILRAIRHFVRTSTLESEMMEKC